jgi:hypothetical protein
MNEKLDKNLRQWLYQLADDWAMPVTQAALNIGKEEVINRLENYPKVCSVLSVSTLNINKFSETARSCWALGGKFDAIRFNSFVSKGQSATKVIQELISNFPETDDEAIKRIDKFVSDVVGLGYSREKSSDWSGAALLASVILTALYPKRFVDFRQSRWYKFAQTFGYEHPLSKEKFFGEKLIWSGKFAGELSETRTFQQYWPQNEPLWIISGMCWVGPEPLKPKDIEDEDKSFIEGAKKWKLHLTRERSHTVVSEAKKKALSRDQMLRCEICGFSFIEKYGELGAEFIEAHHTQPISTLESGSRTKVEDIALLCANCHRMIHRGERTLTLDELRQKLQS